MCVPELIFKQEGQFLTSENIHHHIRMIGIINVLPTYTNMISKYSIASLTGPRYPGNPQYRGFLFEATQFSIQMNPDNRGIVSKRGVGNTSVCNLVKLHTNKPR